ncbi:MAG: dTDP-4-dehydrorhamnose reductase [Candidatus Doudnabacteria bacterium RIFCSPLOWO2_02_FULL_49_13]|uniref:dTDP-4-dehydrorhamnose reductase n=1 Tax=Candidatus Doudnabacteria bacterium RIFCSPHIGHO2_12_FULL_48_16 TaxID=1817838 RepID=A0A1F5PL12_9BACT|nr:MAG: dTDP-4-dehydrorhamnose reductase [Candidatus Doudnabacteria bacterium RIFCSPHIGHO2_02_FULL_49_24]OGE88852.1 MAG: dTDP-4-dehydrorhamnose reductase [Candidatus Doudnabacteria bacterium RIFCSPHIGHO2_01_FULL_50_67]OGE90628.1 MAG: dTDP-4-dehydrorhamnose reductase [Candidatus Doudnabacteria bacterium RIFCSPHIGHO2_12_FULL_48_16]OGE96959.1 MAG: dTDP-4-dehydrorhamnose reductase [Candidatus Doudnabacteria bacterium RIFCSPLOWO2_01_FULL_49_40]OGF02493.1 MAG: dTDP-4-dehydrorhamnose reductase [Candid
MKVLILGAKGNLGQAMVEVYHGHEVSAWDRAELDITDPDAVTQKITELAPELIINCAAYNAVDKAEEDRAIADQINGYAVGFVAKAAAQIGATIVHYSTGQIFDGGNSGGYNENDKPCPVNAYGMSKFMGEIELQNSTENFYLIRTCWLYGKPAVGPDAAVGGAKKSFTDIMLEMAKEGKPINAVSNEFGNPTYVVDLAQATRALIEQQKPFGIYHLVNSGTASRYDWAQEIFAIKGISPELNSVEGRFFERRAKRPKYEVLNNNNFIQLRPWTEALREYLA